MNYGQFKDSVPHICLTGAVVVSWSLMQEMEGSRPLTVMTAFRENAIVSQYTQTDQDTANIYPNEPTYIAQMDNGIP